MNDSNMSQLTEQAVREQAANGDKRLIDIITKLDELRAAGKKIEVRLSIENQSISLVEIIPVSVDLGEIAAEALQDVDDEMAAAGAEDVA